ncbi:MAG: AMP-binding protein, partial [Clostridiales bacterium]|nr:AMP-binding protein [Clostridiales bacterium]
MDVLSSTIRELLVKSEAAYGSWDAFRYKVKQKGGEGKKTVQVESKTYTELKNDSERFSAVLSSIGAQKSHIAILGATSYEWIVAYMGTVNSGSVAVPLDAQLQPEDLCDLLNRAEVTTLVYDETKKQVAEEAKKLCPG